MECWGELRDLGGRRGLVTGLATGRMTDLLHVPLGQRNNLISELHAEQLSFWSVRFMASDYISTVPVLSEMWYEIWWSCQCSLRNFLFPLNLNNRKFPQSLHRASINRVSLRPLPTSFSSRSFHNCSFGLSHGCAGITRWKGTVCPRMIPTYWKPSPHLVFWTTVSPCFLWALLTGL